MDFKSLRNIYLIIFSIYHSLLLVHLCKTNSNYYYLGSESGIVLSFSTFFQHTNGQGLRPRFYFYQVGSKSLVTPSGRF